MDTDNSIYREIKSAPINATFVCPNGTAIFAQRIANNHSRYDLIIKTMGEMFGIANDWTNSSNIVICDYLLNDCDSFSSIELQNFKSYTKQIENGL